MSNDFLRSFESSYENAMALEQILEEAKTRYTNSANVGSFLAKYGKSLKKIKDPKSEANRLVDRYSMFLEEAKFLHLVSSFEEVLGRSIQLTSDELKEVISESERKPRMNQNARRNFVVGTPQGLAARYELVQPIPEYLKKNYSLIKEKRDYLAHGKHSEANKIPVTFEEAYTCLKGILSYVVSESE